MLPVSRSASGNVSGNKIKTSGGPEAGRRMMEGDVGGGKRNSHEGERQRARERGRRHRNEAGGARKMGEEEAGWESEKKTSRAAEAGDHMVPCGLEPRTLRLLAVRSSQLSYETTDEGCTFF